MEFEKEVMLIEIPGAPIAKRRPRFARRGKFVTTYNDQETEEGRWLWCAKPQITGRFDGPVRMVCIFRFSRPKSHYGTGRNENRLKPTSPVVHINKPDVSNLVKFAEDCLNGMAYRDDSQLVEILARKEWADEPGTMVILEAI
jgi:Holliday junction resolvase RusA-like endonuclease